MQQQVSITVRNEHSHLFYLILFLLSAFLTAIVTVLLSTSVNTGVFSVFFPPVVHPADTFAVVLRQYLPSQLPVLPYGVFAARHLHPRRQHQPFCSFHLTWPSLRKASRTAAVEAISPCCCSVLLLPSTSPCFSPYRAGDAGSLDRRISGACLSQPATSSLPECNNSTRFYFLSPST